MPIEIRELVIKALVDSNHKKRLALSNKKKAPERIIQDCVDQFVEILKQEKER